MRITLKTKVIGTFLAALALIVLCQGAVYLVMLGSVHHLKKFYTGIMDQSEASNLEYLFYRKMLAVDDYLLFPDETRLGLLNYADKAFTAKLGSPAGGPDEKGLNDLLGAELRRMDLRHTEAGIGRIEGLEKEILTGIGASEPRGDAVEAVGEGDAGRPGTGETASGMFIPALEGSLNIQARTHELLEYLAIRNLSMLKKNASRRFLITGRERYVREFYRLDWDLVRRTDALYEEVANKFDQEGQSLKYIKESNAAITASFRNAVRLYRSGDTKEAAAAVQGSYLSEEMLDSTVSDLAEGETIQFNSAYRSLDPIMKFSVLFSRTLLAYLLSLVGVLAIIVYEAVSRMTKPIVRLSEVSRRIAEGDWTQRLEVVTRDEIGGMAASFNSMTEQLEKSQKELARLYEETRALSLKDSLTGLANRRMMDILFGKSFDRAKRLGSPFSVIMLDIDHFKKYNDTFGHPAGDALLVKIADMLQGEVREMDLAVRYGGEEFFVLLPDSALAEARKVAERIRGKVQADSPVTVSLGISAYRPGMGTKEDVLRQADEALYKAKREGRNRVEVSEVLVAG